MGSEALTSLRSRREVQIAWSLLSRSRCSEISRSRYTSWRRCSWCCRQSGRMFSPHGPTSTGLLDRLGSGRRRGSFQRRGHRLRRGASPRVKATAALRAYTAHHNARSPPNSPPRASMSGASPCPSLTRRGRSVGGWYRAPFANHDKGRPLFRMRLLQSTLLDHLAHGAARSLGSSQARISLQSRKGLSRKLDSRIRVHGPMRHEQRARAGIKECAG
jgi:hypothetical protein